MYLDVVGMWWTEVRIMALCFSYFLKWYEEKNKLRDMEIYGG